MMGYKEVKENNKYCEHLIEMCAKNQFGLSLPPAQIEVLKVMLLNDYVLFRHGRGVGATFMLAVLSAMLHLADSNIVIVTTSKNVNLEIETNSRYGLAPLDVVSMEDALSGEYDVLLLDEITCLPKEHVDSLVKHIEDKTIPKIIATCGGYRRYFPIMELEGCMYRDCTSRVIITKDYEDMPEGFFDSVNIEEAKKLYDYPEEFDMEFKGFIL